MAKNAERSQSVGAPLVGTLPRAKRREKAIGRGTPCGCPSHGKNAERSQSVEGHPLWVPFPWQKRREKPIGRGTPCGCPSHGKNAERSQSVGAPLWVPFPWQKRREKPIGRGTLVGALPWQKRREKPIGRGTPCGCPSWGIVTSEFTCDCAVPRAPPWIKGVKGVLRAPSRPFVDQRC